MPSVVTAATRFTTDSAASERRPTDPVSSHAAVLRAMVTTAAAMESQANRASDGRGVRHRRCAGRRVRSSDRPLPGGKELAEDLAGAPEHLHGGVPVDAGVGDRAAVAELREVGRDGLVPGLEEALHHEADHRAVALADLVDDVAHDERLQLRLLPGVGVGAVDDQVAGQLGLGERLLGQRDGDGVEVGTPAAAAQHQVAVAVAAGADDGRAPLRR